MRHTITIIAALLVAACCPTPPPVEPIERGPLPQPDAVCAHLAELGCPEGADAACARKIVQVEHDRLTLLPERCWMAAKTKSDVRKCGQIACAGAP